MWSFHGESFSISELLPWIIYIRMITSYHYSMLRIIEIDDRPRVLKWTQLTPDTKLLKLTQVNNFIYSIFIYSYIVELWQTMNLSLVIDYIYTSRYADVLQILCCNCCFVIWGLDLYFNDTGTMSHCGTFIVYVHKLSYDICTLSPYKSFCATWGWNMGAATGIK